MVNKDDSNDQSVLLANNSESIESRREILQSTKASTDSESGSVSRRDVLVTVGAAGITGLAGCTGSSDNSSNGGTTTATSDDSTQSSAPLRMGLLQPLTGTYGEVGQNGVDGAEVARSNINEAGGIHGRTLEFETGDTKTQQQAGLQAFETLLSSDLIGMMGPSSVVMPSLVQPVQDNKIPMVANMAGTIELDSVGGDWLFRSVVSDRNNGQAIALYAQKQGWENLSAMYINTSGARSMQVVTKESAEALGLGTGPQIEVQEAASSYRSSLRDIQQSDTDMMLFAGGESAFKVFIKNYNELGMEIPVMTGVVCCFEDVIDSVGHEEMEGVYGFDQSTGPAFQKFATLFEEQHGSGPTSFSDPSYDAINMMAIAAEVAEEPTRQGIRDNISKVCNPPGTEVHTFAEAKEELANGNEVNYQGASSSQNLNKNGDPIAGVRLQQVQDGDWNRVSRLSSNELLEAFE